MAERLSRVETTERKEKKAHPMQLKYEYDATSRKYTEKYTRAKKVSRPHTTSQVSVPSAAACSQQTTRGKQAFLQVPGLTSPLIAAQGSNEDSLLDTFRSQARRRLSI